MRRHTPESRVPVEILQTNKLLASCEEGLAERFTVHKLHEAADREALLREAGPRIRGVATMGSIDRALMEKLPALEIVSSFGVGYDGVDVAAAKERKVRVTNTPNVLNDAVAEITIGLMIALARRIPQGDRFVRDGRWSGTKGAGTSFGLYSELTGRTLGILGLGRIGKEIAVRAQAMKMRIVYHGRHRQPREPYVYYDNLTDMARDSDWLVIIAPGGKSTSRVVSREVLEALGPEGYLVNVARGTLIDEPALVEMLKEGRLGGAALDVFEKEPQVPEALFALDNVVLSPHQGSATHETRRLMGQLVVDNLVAHFAGEPLISPVA
jgi:lactate dehydrogenase-like 2-hydroxyacid dehydrogenase